MVDVVQALAGQARRTVIPTALIMHHQHVSNASQRGRRRRITPSSWSSHECTLILMLVIGIVLHYNETPT
jgi:hypothetical protein